MVAKRALKCRQQIVVLGQGELDDLLDCGPAEVVYIIHTALIPVLQTSWNYWRGWGRWSRMLSKRFFLNVGWKVASVRAKLHCWSKKRAPFDLICQMSAAIFLDCGTFNLLHRWNRENISHGYCSGVIKMDKGEDRKKCKRGAASGGMRLFYRCWAITISFFRFHQINWCWGPWT